MKQTSAIPDEFFETLRVLLGETETPGSARDRGVLPPPGKGGSSSSIGPALPFPHPVAPPSN